MLANVAQQLPLALPGGAPVRKFILEPVLVLATIFVIVAVEGIDLAAAPLAVVRVVQLAGGGRSHAGEAAAALLVPVAVLRTAIVSSQRPIAIIVSTRPSSAEAAGVRPAIALVA